MALTVRIQAAGGDELALTFDAPRVVIGRSPSCEVLLPDPSVSPRHASIRYEGGRSLVIDEGSTNGIMVGSVRLPPHTPRALGDGDWVRIGRVWLRVQLGVGVPSGPREGQAVARELVRRQLLSEGEPADPELRVTAGPAVGARLALTDPEREYVVGRGRDVDLPLADEHCSRRHVSIAEHEGVWQVRDLGSKRGTTLAEQKLTSSPAAWTDGAELRLGDSVLVLRSALPEAFAEALRAPDARMRPEEHHQRPPGEGDRDPARPVQALPEAPISLPEPTPTPSSEERLSAPQPTGKGYATVDTFVVLVALGLLALSALALWWVL